MEIKSIIKTIELLFILLYFTGCAGIPSLQERKQTLQTIIDSKPYKSETISTTNFNLFAVRDKNLNQCVDRPLKVYIEGDGHAWATKHTISEDPTPVNPLALKLMSMDNDPCKVYLARPCQYVSSSSCNEHYWTNQRFDPKVIQSYQEALNQWKQTYQNRSFTLIGYSGGAAVAILTAAQRDDVKRIITIAGNVDTAKWVEIHNLDPLNGSLNPAEYANNVEKIEQLHIIGIHDTVVPKEVFLSYLKRFDDQSHIRYTFMDATHTRNWEKAYQNILSENK